MKRRLFEWAFLIVTVFANNPLLSCSYADLWRRLSDGFFMAGMVISGVALLGFVKGQGGFSMVEYGFLSLRRCFGEDKKRESYLSYHARTRDDRWWLSQAADGAVLMGIGVFFFIIWTLTGG